MFVGCSEFSISVTINHVQHIGILRAFCLPGGDLLSISMPGGWVGWEEAYGENIAELWLARGDQYPG